MRSATQCRPKVRRGCANTGGHEAARRDGRSLRLPLGSDASRGDPGEGATRRQSGAGGPHSGPPHPPAGAEGRMSDPSTALPNVGGRSEDAKREARRVASSPDMRGASTLLVRGRKSPPIVKGVETTPAQMKEPTRGKSRRKWRGCGVAPAPGRRFRLPR